MKNVWDALWRGEPVAFIAVVLLTLFVFQKFWLHDWIDTEWVEWALETVVMGSGVLAARNQVYSKQTVEDWLPEEYREG